MVPTSEVIKEIWQELIRGRAQKGLGPTSEVIKEILQFCRETTKNKDIVGK